MTTINFNLSGVYQIRNLLNSEIYIGSAVNFRKRWNTHRSCLRNNKHTNKFLQRAWNKYKESSFEFSILLKCSPEECISCETYLKNYYCADYNLCEVGNNRLGLKHSEETKKKMSDIRRGKFPSKESRVKMSESARQRKHSEETRRKISLVSTGRKMSEHTKLKLLKANKGRSLTQEHVEKLNIKKSKAIIQICPKTNIILAQFKSIKTASETIAVGKSAVGNCLRGLSKSAGGYFWKYAE